MTRPEIIAVVGPTASGKSDFSVSLARALSEVATPAEIINADAMQLYRGMNIGTAKLTVSERQGVTHHLFDVFEPEVEVSVAQYQQLARSSATNLIERGVTPIFVGGSMLYLSAALDELDFDPFDPELRERMLADLERVGAAEMHRRLAEIDSAAAAKLSPNNVRRVLRALEVNELTGRNFRADLPEPSSWRPTLWLGLNPGREQLRERIERRCEQMWRNGFLDEVSELTSMSQTAAVAHGYPQARAQLAGVMTEPEAIAETVQITARYAKRQLSWFRRDKRIHWLSEPDALNTALKLIGV